MPRIRGRPRWVVDNARPRPPTALCGPRRRQRANGRGADPFSFATAALDGAPVLLVFSRLNSAAPAGAAFFLPEAARRILHSRHALRTRSRRAPRSAPTCARRLSPRPPTTYAPVSGRPNSRTAVVAPGASATRRTGRSPSAAPRRASLRKARRLDPPLALGSTKDGGSEGGGHGRRRDRPSAATTVRPLGRGIPAVPAKGGAAATPRTRAQPNLPHRHGGVFDRPGRHRVRWSSAGGAGQASARPPARREDHRCTTPLACRRFGSLLPLCSPPPSVRGLSSGSAGASGAASTA
jgi:hypothetical protein